MATDMLATDTVLLTAEEYAALPEVGRPTELVRGELIEMNPPRHATARSVLGQLTSSEFTMMNMTPAMLCAMNTGVLTEHLPGFRVSVRRFFE